jgi:hypothetical protein
MHALVRILVLFFGRHELDRFGTKPLSVALSDGSSPFLLCGSSKLPCHGAWDSVRSSAFPRDSRSAARESPPLDGDCRIPLARSALARCQLA